MDLNSRELTFKIVLLYVLILNSNSYFSGQIENLPHSQLVYGYATSAQKTNNSLTRTLTCLCYNFITNIVEGKEKSVNLFLNKKNHTMKIIRSFRPTISRKKITQKTFSALLTKKKSIQSFFFSSALSKSYEKSTKT